MNAELELDIFDKHSNKRDINISDAGNCHRCKACHRKTKIMKFFRKRIL